MHREQVIINEVVKILVKYISPDVIYLFGSRAKRETIGNPDFDFAVDAKRPEVRTERLILDEIEDIAGLYSVDVVYLQSVDKKFREIVYETGKVVYDRRSVNIS